MEGSSSRTWLIVGGVVIILCCVCAVCGGVGYWLWENGDRLLEEYAIRGLLILV
jgi:hypothetical protein